MSTTASASTATASGFEEIRRTDNEKGRYTLIFLAPPGEHETPRSS